jgi:hypothetical protein
MAFFCFYLWVFVFLPTVTCLVNTKRRWRRLERHFGGEYTQYASYCRSLMPRLKPYTGADKRKWSISLFWYENREQYFILIVVSIFAAIIFKLK